MNTQQIQTISTETLRILLSNLKGATPVTIVAETEVKMNKKGNPYFGKVTKLIRSNVFVNFIYQNSVNKQRQKENKETDFVSAERRWGKKIQGTPLIEHNGEYYLEARFLNAVEPKYYFLGHEIEKKEIATFLPTKPSSSRQNVETEVIIRDYKLSSIREIIFNKQHFQVI